MKAIETGDILLVDTEGFIPSKIDKFQGNDYNHAGIFVRIFGQIYVFEAIDTGQAFTPIQEYHKRMAKEDINMLVLKPKEKIWREIHDPEFMNFLLPLTRAPYEYSNLLFFQMVKYIAKKITGRELWIGRKKARSNRAFICGELVAYIYNHFHGWFEDWYKIAPVDLYESPNFKHIKYQPEYEHF